ncbi:MAG: GAF domain-containing sensor histidine kinase [Acidobacteria bacterium]|nr:GAF domain-containing sensor histidine kinase [Acidobacteriota bacterium]
MTAGEFDSSADEARLLERQLVRLRWFGVALGVFAVWGTYRDPSAGPVAPSYVRPLGYLIIGLFALANGAIWAGTRRSAPARIGLLAFLTDAVALFAMSWLYSFDPAETSWVILYILPLEGAARYQIWGAMAPVAAALPNQVLHELYRSEFVGGRLDMVTVAFRVGIMAIIGAVAGMGADRLRRERERADLRAGELQAFQEIVLAGAAGVTLDATVGSIAVAMSGTLGYDRFGIGLLESASGGTAVRCVAAAGFPSGTVGTVIPPGRGICGRVVATGEPQLVSDTALDPDFVEVQGRARSELAVPIVAHDRLIGVVNVESPEPGHFTPEDCDRLSRLAPQIGLIISNARLLAGERAALDRLRELDAMRSDFIAVASHELRSPLTAISGFVKTLRRSDIERTRDILDQGLSVIDRQADRLIGLVENLLLTEQLDAHAVRLTLEPVELPALAAEVLDEIGDGQARVRVESGGALTEVRTDPQRLRQVIRNLVDNALKFSPPSAPVDLRLRGEPGAVVIEVADRGPGIPVEDLPSIFDRFQQGGTPRATRSRGVGLGLYITKTIVDLLGGSIDVSSVAGGTTFRVRLPVAAIEDR